SGRSSSRLRQVSWHHAALRWTQPAQGSGTALGQPPRQDDLKGSQHGRTRVPAIDMTEPQRRGKLKIYIGYAAGVGKTFKMLKETQKLRAADVDVAIGY